MDFEIFDGHLECQTGLCQIDIKEELIDVACIVEKLRNKGFKIKRYNMTRNKDIFEKNEIVSKLINENGERALPIIFKDEEVVKFGSYPSIYEFRKWTNFNKEELSIDDNYMCNCMGSCFE